MNIVRDVPQQPLWAPSKRERGVHHVRPLASMGANATFATVAQCCQESLSSPRDSRGRHSRRPPLHIPTDMYASMAESEYTTGVYSH